MSLNLPPDLQEDLDARLDAIDEVLQRYRQTRSARSAILDELEGQIHEELRDTAGKREATRADLDAVLGRLDPPEAYARNSIDFASLPAGFGFGDEPEPGFNRATLAALIWAGWFMLAGMVLATLLAIRVSPEARLPTLSGGDSTFIPAMYAYQTWWGTLIIIFLCIPGFVGLFGTTTLGWLGINQIRQSRGRQYGLDLAAVSTLFFPLILGNGVALIVLLAIIRTGTEGPSNVGVLLLAAIALLWIAFLVYLNWKLGRRFWRRINRP